MNSIMEKSGAQTNVDNYHLSQDEADSLFLGLDH